MGRRTSSSFTGTGLGTGCRYRSPGDLSRGLTRKRATTVNTARVAPQVLDRDHQIFGPARAHSHLFAGDRVIDLQLFGVKRGSPDQWAFIAVGLEAVHRFQFGEQQWLSPVKRITDQRRSLILQMRPNLVR